MPEVQIRKQVRILEEIFHEGGPAAATPRKRGAIVTVIENPFAGRYVEDIAGFMEDLKPLGAAMAKELLAALGGDDVARAVDADGERVILIAAFAARADEAEGIFADAFALRAGKQLPKDSKILLHDIRNSQVHLA